MDLGLNRGFAMNHLYPSNGVYELELNVSDDDGGSTTRNATIIVGPRPPPELSIYSFAGLVVRGVVGRSYEIQKRDSLASSNWTTITTLTLSNSAQLWIDLNSTNTSSRFYRALEIP